MSTTPSAPQDESPFFVAMRDQVAETPMPHGRRFRRPSAPRPVVRRRTFTGVAVTLAATITALVIAFGAASSSAPPAYALVVGPGRVTITLGPRLRDLHELNAKLAALGTRMRVVPIHGGCVAPVHVTRVASYSDVKMAPGPAHTYSAGRLVRRAEMRITVEQFPSGQNWVPRGMTLVLPVSRTGRFSTRTPVVRGPAPRCVAP